MSFEQWCITIILSLVLIVLTVAMLVVSAFLVNANDVVQGLGALANMVAAFMATINLILAFTGESDCHPVVHIGMAAVYGFVVFKICKFLWIRL